jgi:hypothetical protein
LFQLSLLVGLKKERKREQVPALQSNTATMRSMPRYVILEHDHPTLHWDFLLEAGDTLRSWRLAAPPQSGQRVAAASSFAHRLLYLDYEGPVSGNRGQVVQWDRGDYEELPADGQQLQVRLRGRKLRGTATLEPTGTLLFQEEDV